MATSPTSSGCTRAGRPTGRGPRASRASREVKRALSEPAALKGAIDYYRALPLGGSKLLERPPAVPNLAVGGTADLVPAELYQASAELFPAPSRALIVERAGHWPHREDEAAVVPEIVRFVSEL